MGDIVEFKKREEKNRDEFMFSMDMYRTPEGELRAFLTNINTEDGRSERERERLHADLLDAAAFSIEEEMYMDDEPGSRGLVLATVKVYESGTVRVRVRYDIQGKKRMSWMRNRLMECWGMVRDIMSNRPPEGAEKTPN